MNSEPYPEPLNFNKETPEDLLDFSAALIKYFPHGGPWLTDLISYLPEMVIGYMVSESIKLLNEKSSEAAEEIIAHVSLQFPHLLHPYLDQLLSLKPNKQTYYAEFPWRNSGTLHFEQLKNALKSSDQDTRKLSLEAMFQTRHPEVLEAALEARPRVEAMETKDAQTLKLFEEFQKIAEEFAEITGNTDSPFATGDRSLLRMGLERKNGIIAPLYPSKSWHIIFSPEYLKSESMPPHLRRHHPTWNLPIDHGMQLRFGGKGKHACGVCNNPSHHLVTFHKLPDELGVKACNRLTLETCLSCMPWEEGILYYKHKSNGEPEPLNPKNSGVVPQFPHTAFIETTAFAVETPPRWQWQDWALANARQNLNRAGGHPTWIQSADYPVCPICSTTMHFLLQLDSWLPTQSDPKFLWASGGICYTFWCDPCRVSCLFVQCT